MLRGRLPWLSTIGVWLALAATATGARAAAGEDEWQLSARLGVATLDVDGRSPLGTLAGAEVEYGITDAWALRLSVGSGFHPVDAVAKTHLPGGTARTNMALAGVTYTVDVLRLVPYLEVGIGVINFGGAVLTPGTTLDPPLGAGRPAVLPVHARPALRLAHGLWRHVVLLRGVGARLVDVLTAATGASAERIHRYSAVALGIALRLCLWARSTMRIGAPSKP